MIAGDEHGFEVETELCSALIHHFDNPKAGDRCDCGLVVWAEDTLEGWPAINWGRCKP